jgi:hypothetical protein
MLATVYPDRSQFTRRMRVGDIQNRKIWVACAKCNNEWMSRLQTSVKPYLLPLVHGEVTVLDKKGQETLAAWIAMTVSVAEFFDDTMDRIAISTKDRIHIRKTQTAPPHWKIWLGYFVRGNWQPFLIHNTVPVSSPKNRIKRNDAGAPLPNTQTMAFAVNKLYIFAASSATDIFEDWRITANGVKKLTQVWPFKRNIIGWPPAPLSDREADQIAGAFFLFAEERGRRNAIRRVGGSALS